MKTIVKVLLAMLAVVLISQCKDDEPNPIVTIPDNNFLSALIDLGVDANRDGIISPEEAEVIKSLEIRDFSITDMTGIEAFVNLENLNCGENQLTSLDVSNNTALKELFCFSNQLTSLDVSHNTALTVLSLEVNQLTSLDVSNNTALTFLSLSNNQLTNLDVSNNTALEWLFLSHNQLTSLDVSNNTALTSIDLHDMPSINEVCVWKMPFPPDGVGVNTRNSTNVYFTTDCTGGD